jgi:hypothetical protein
MLRGAAAAGCSVGVGGVGRVSYPSWILTFNIQDHQQQSSVRELQLGVACAAPACDYAANHCMGVCNAMHATSSQCLSGCCHNSWNTDSVRTPCLIRPLTGLCYRVGNDTLRGAARCCVGWVVFTGVSIQDGQQQRGPALPLRLSSLSSVDAWSLRSILLPPTAARVTQHLRSAGGWHYVQNNTGRNSAAQ